MDFEELLEEIRARKSSSPILTADRYFKAISTCFDGGFCPTKVFEKASQDDWVKALKGAESQLVYSPGEEELAKDFFTNDLRDGAIMEFEAVITTDRRDRDRDILETKGADLDVNAPLLWQHMPFEPIGKVYNKTIHTESLMAGSFGIADTELGRDAATLAEFGALRISHGFDPSEFEPLKNEGWLFTKFDIHEVSLVSVPSNVDAVITAFSRGKLHSPLIGGWAQRSFEGRDKKFKGIDLSDIIEVKDGTRENVLIVADGNVGTSTGVELSDKLVIKSDCECKKLVEPGKIEYKDLHESIVKKAFDEDSEVISTTIRQLQGVLDMRKAHHEEQQWQDVCDQLF